MPRDLGPQNLAFQHALRKGALVLLPPRTQASSPSLMLRFQYNPETITRVRSGAWEQRRNGRTPRPAPTEQERAAAAFRGGGLFAKSETVSLKLTFDATELALRGTPGTPNSGGAADGILPELAVLEKMGISEAPGARQGAQTTQTSPNSARLNEVAPKELLLILNRRVFPVIITQMTITEKRFNPELVPVRADVDLQMQILETTEVAGNQPMRDAFDKLMDDRGRWAGLGSQSITLTAGNLQGSLDTVISQALTQTGRSPGGGA